MATFDFLASENVVDEEAMSDGENDDGLPDDDDQQLVIRSKVKVILDNFALISSVVK